MDQEYLSRNSKFKHQGFVKDLRGLSFLIFVLTLMKIVENKFPHENQRSLDDIIGLFINDLMRDEKKNRKKIVEVCHVGKFLMLLGDDYWIDRLLEKPDFVLKSNGVLVGLEHQIVIDSVAKEKEGFIENVFSLAEEEMKKDNELPNFLANCYLKGNLDYQLSDKNEFVTLIKKVVKQHILTGTVIPNPLIDHIRVTPHSQKNLYPNFGAWWQKNLTPEIVVSAVTQKEVKLSSYQKNSGPEQWLLLVTGSLKDSSYEVDSEFEVELNTKFDRVFLMEDFSARLFELK